ncbi:hypothetical protein ACJ72_06443 [Emergomyces africanus]|uniref:Uncharacterized protein n=1 Tax=Emergomyces africanus TaxID=1955775 RepID=A0A1B7NR16_9EURO|nr:hypothetical protein ACJ72_06443 [Emergomyces africanus]
MSDASLKIMYPSSLDGYTPTKPSDMPSQISALHNSHHWASGRRKVDDMDENAFPETPDVRSRSSRPLADQFCVYNASPGEAIPALIVKYNAPHKLTKDIVETGQVARWRIATCISQTFSYMIHAGLEYGYVCTGTNVCISPETTDWASGPDGDNRLHLTAMGLFALLTPFPKTRIGVTRWKRFSRKWEVARDDKLGPDSVKSSCKQVSNYKRNLPSRNEYMRLWPIKTLSKGPVVSPSCRPRETSTNWDTSNDGSSGNGGYDSDSPSRKLQAVS